MSSELTPLDAEDNAAVDMLLEIGDVNSWDISWDLDTDIMDVLDVVDDAEHDEHSNAERAEQEQEVVEGEGEEVVLQEYTLVDETNIDWLAGSEQDLIEHIPQSAIMEESYINIEVELAELDGADETDDGELIEPQLLHLPVHVGIASAWSVVAPLTTSSTVEVLRLCFARIAGNEYRIYDALDNVGYQPTAGPPLLISEISPKEGLLDGLQLLEGYVHIFPYTELPEHVKQMIQDETGADVAELLNNSDCLFGIDIVPDAEWDIMCVGRRERVAMEFRSQTVPPDEKHSGINIFGEATRVSLTISNTEIVLENEAILEMSHQPEINIFFYANSNNIYVLNGRTLFENTELGKHVLPINNIDLIPISPPHTVSVSWETKEY